MNLCGHCFSQNANQKLQGFLPYQTKRIVAKKTAYNHQKITKRKCYDPCLYGRAEILVIIGLHFGRNDDLINSFWIELTFSVTSLFGAHQVNTDLFFCPKHRSQKHFFYLTCSDLSGSKITKVDFLFQKSI